MSKYKRNYIGVAHLENKHYDKYYIAKTKSEKGSRIVSFEVIGAFTDKQKLVDALSYNGFVGQDDLYVKVTKEDKIIAEIQEILIID